MRGLMVSKNMEWMSYKELLEVLDGEVSSQ